MGKRHDRHVFMPGKFVFPGGRVDPSDRRMPVAVPLDSRAEQKLMLHSRRPNANKAQALALAAVRETFEETGLLSAPRVRPRQAAGRVVGVRRDQRPSRPVHHAFHRPRGDSAAAKAAL